MSENLRQHIYFWSLIYLAISLPGQFLWFPPTLGILGLGLAWLLSFRWKEKWRRLTSNRPLHLILLLFGISLAGMIYTQNPAEGWKDITVKMALFAFPIALASVPKIPENQKEKILQTFVYATSAAALFLLVSAYFYFQNNGENVALTHRELLHFKRVPVHYFALYAAFSVFVFLEKIINGKNKNLGLNILNALCIVLLINVVLKTGVRIQMLAFPVALLVFLFLKIPKKKMALGVFAAAAAAFLLLALLTPTLRSRFTDTFNEVRALRGEMDKYQTNHRVYLWKDGWRVIRENFWIGTGTGSANDFLYQKISEKEIEFWKGNQPYLLSDKKYNYHNEFLQHWASVGILGFLILLAVFGYGIYLAWHRKDAVAVAFLLLCAVAFLTESMLERQAGNLFFGFFYAFLIVNSRAKNQPVFRKKKHPDLMKEMA